MECMPTSSGELISMNRKAREQSTWGGNFYSAGRISSAKLRFIQQRAKLRAGFGHDLAALSPMDSPS
jgi:hypothetical protein